MGPQAQAELIRMLDDPATSQADAGTIIQILFVYFRSEESARAMESYASRMGDPRLSEMIGEMRALMKAKDPDRR